MPRVLSKRHWPHLTFAYVLSFLARCWDWPRSDDRLSQHARFWPGGHSCSLWTRSHSNWFPLNLDCSDWFPLILSHSDWVPLMLDRSNGFPLAPKSVFPSLYTPRPVVVPAFLSWLKWDLTHGVHMEIASRLVCLVSHLVQTPSENHATGSQIKEWE